MVSFGRFLLVFRDGTPTSEGCHPMAYICNVSEPLVINPSIPLPLAELGIASSTRSSRLAHASTSAPNVCLSEPSLFGNADLKASAGASRQWHCRQRPTPLTVRSSSDNIKLSPRMKMPAG